MLFNSVEYAALMLGAFAGYWILASMPQARNVFLLAVSYFFYGCWSVKYLSLIFFSSSHDFGIALLMKQARRAGRQGLLKPLMAAGVIADLGILCTFKYFNFFADSASDLLAVFGIQASPFHLNVLLPVGISFYTFQTLSYTIDVYREKLEPIRDPIRYLLFVSFFPQLVAGPIVRASRLLPQLANRPALSAKEGSRAVFLIGLGLAKKVVIADFLGAHLVDPVFSNPVMYSSVETLAAVYGYAFQIYADFSAYSDIAIGSAALLGFKIPINFNAPYTAGNLREFWQRWHISLSTWLRDYLYIPLGGSKRHPARIYLNLLVTMLLGGLWHGAALTFVFWGAIHGHALVVTRVVQRLKVLDALPRTARKTIGVILTFHLVCAAWVFFRAQSLSAALEIFSNLTALDLGFANLTSPVIAILGLAVFTHWIPASWMETFRRWFHLIPAPVQAAALVLLIISVRQLARAEVTPFIYFQF